MPVFDLDWGQMSCTYESTYGKGDEKIAKSHGHSTNMVAQVARDASAKTPSSKSRISTFFGA